MKKAQDFPKLLLFREATDMRKQSYGLEAMVEEKWQANPFSDCLFLFCNKRRDILKALYFDNSGFCLWTKKLDQNKFPWLKDINLDRYEINAKDFELLIEGVDIFKRHKKLKFTSIS